MGKQLGQADDPLLVSVRSGAKFSMPGMMDTVLNIGLNDASVEGLAAQSANERFAWDSYRRLVAMFGKTVLGVDGDLFEDALWTSSRSQSAAASDLDLDAADLRDLVATYKQIVQRETGRDFPQDPREQLDLAIRAVFDSWNTDRAVLYRRQERIPADLGTAVNVQSMVFGNLGDNCGTGVAFTRDPARGSQGVYGDYLENAQGEDVVAGIRNTVPLADLEQIDKKSYDELMAIMQTLEEHYRDLCDIEFTVERGKLWMLQTRVGKRTAAAAFRIAVQLVDQGLITMDEAVERVNGAQLAQLMFPQFDPAAERTRLTKGMNASPGAAVGRAVFDSHTAVEWAERGEKVILVRRETNPDDLHGMVAAAGILTSRGGKTSHAAVVARGMGRTCVCGADELDVDVRHHRLVAKGGVEVQEGDLISIDGTTGDVFLGEVPVMDSAVVRYFEGDEAAADDELVAAVARIMEHADATRRMQVRANADTPGDAARARRFGAQGIGLCRTEHMFLGDRRELVEHLILAETDAEREDGPLRPAAAPAPGLRRDLRGDGRAAGHGPADRPAAARVPARLHRAVDEGRGGRGRRQAEQARRQAALRGEADARGEPDAGAARRPARDRHPRPVHHAGAGDPRGRRRPDQGRRRPAAGDHDPAGRGRPGARAGQGRRDRGGRRGPGASRGWTSPFKVGTMIELPRAAMTADAIAEAAEFFSFGTNDLTQMTWGFSRDDVEAAFFSTYLEKGIFGVSPFETLDREGVGALVSEAVQRGRSARPDIHLGVCGEHGGDPDSIHFFDAVGLDYVSCSPFRVPVARLEAGRASEGPSGSA